MPLLEVKNLNVSFLSDGRLLPAVSDVSFTVEPGEILARVGESGCGKSITCMSLAKLLPASARILGGSVNLRTGSGEVVDVMQLDGRALRVLDHDAFVGRNGGRCTGRNEHERGRGSQKCEQFHDGCLSVFIPNKLSDLHCNE